MILRRSLLILAGGGIGALLIGGGGRLVMRLLGIANGIAPSFSLGGTAEILLYGALLGAAGGLATPLIRGRGLLGGLLLGLGLYAGAVLTLPGHIAATAAPFAGSMAWVWLSFGLCFLLWGLAMARVAERTLPIGPVSVKVPPFRRDGHA